MIKAIDIAVKHTEVAPKVRAYALRQFGQLERYIPRKHRTGVHVDVVLSEAKTKGAERFTCNVVLRTPHETFDAKDTNINMHAAIDVAENKLKTQLVKYKETHSDSRKFRHLFVRSLRRGEELR